LYEPGTNVFGISISAKNGFLESELFFEIATPASVIRIQINIETGSISSEIGEKSPN
jgi:hypothetical protein